MRAHTHAHARARAHQSVWPRSHAPDEHFWALLRRYRRKDGFDLTCRLIFACACVRVLVRRCAPAALRGGGGARARDGEPPDELASNGRTYEKVRRIGAGACGVAYAYRDKQSGQLVAVKFPHAAHADDERRAFKISQHILVGTSI